MTVFSFDSLALLVKCLCLQLVSTAALVYASMSCKSTFSCKRLCLDFQLRRQLDPLVYCASVAHWRMAGASASSAGLAQLPPMVCLR